MSIPVVTVGDSRDDLVGGLERLHGPVSVVRRCSELAELLAACQSGLARAAVVAAGSEELTASLVDRLSAVGVVVIALTDNPEETVRLRTIGVAAEARAVDAAALAARISAAVAQLSGTGAGPGPAAGDGAASVAAAGQVPRSSGAQTVTASPGAKGRIIAVWGPAGAPGRTLVAANIAGELAAEGQSVLLVDADSYGASVAALLGLLDEAAGLAQACRLADQGLLDADALLRIATTVADQGRRRCGCSPGSRGRTAGRNCAPRRSRWCWSGPGRSRMSPWWTPASASKPMTSLALTAARRAETPRP